MDVNIAMDTYNLNSLWNSLNPNSSDTATAPLINNLDATINENYTAMNYSGQTTSTELQDIYQQVEPNYGIPLTYNENGNMSIPTTLPASGLSNDDSSIVSLLNGDNTSSENSLINILSQYNSIEDGTFQTNLSSILSSNFNNLYSSIDSLESNQTDTTGNNLDYTV